MEEDTAGWIVWRGGANPVAQDRMVQVRSRYAGIASARAGSLRWEHDLYCGYGADDIVAYRLLPIGPD